MNDANAQLVHGQIIGKFLDRPIYVWVQDPYGARYEFVRALTELTKGKDVDISITVDECIIVPGLLYRKPSRSLDALLPEANHEQHFL